MLIACPVFSFSMTTISLTTGSLDDWANKPAVQRSAAKRIVILFMMKCIYLFSFNSCAYSLGVLPVTARKERWRVRIV